VLELRKVNESVSIMSQCQDTSTVCGDDCHGIICSTLKSHLLDNFQEAVMNWSLVLEGLWSTVSRVRWPRHLLDSLSIIRNGPTVAKSITFIRSVPSVGKPWTTYPRSYFAIH
jgi:hypothetical protein